MSMSLMGSAGHVMFFTHRVKCRASCFCVKLRMESNAAGDMESLWAGHGLENQLCSVWRNLEQHCDRKI